MILGGCMLGTGLALSLVLLLLDFRSSRAKEPYAGIGRMAPEIHVFISLLSGAGGWIAWGWPAGLTIFVGQTILAMALAFKMR